MNNASDGLDGACIVCATDDLAANRLGRSAPQIATPVQSPQGARQGRRQADIRILQRLQPVSELLFVQGNAGLTALVSQIDGSRTQGRRVAQRP